MDEYFNSLFETFWSYITEASGNTWWWLLLIIIVLWLFVFSFTKFKPISTEESTVNGEFSILRWGFIVSSLLLLVLIGYYLYLWNYTTIYLSNDFKLIHILGIILLAIIQIISLSYLRKLFQRKYFLRIFYAPVSRRDDQKKNRLGRKKFNNIKLFGLFPLLAFILLLLPDNQSKLISIVIDNSSSMSSYLENGKQILNNSISDMSNNNAVVISYFSENNPKSSIDEIKSISDFNMLEGIHQFYEQPTNALNSINSIGSSQGTPLFETIWSNYLFTKNYLQDDTYSESYLLLLTDGGDSYVDINAMALCSDFKFEEQFNGGIWIINISDDYNVFFEQMENCAETLEGSDINSFSQSINQVFSTMKKDSYFPVWITIIYLLSFFIILLIKPHKR